MAKGQVELQASIALLEASAVALAARIAALPPNTPVDLTAEVARVDAVTAALDADLPSA